MLDIQPLFINKNSPRVNIKNWPWNPSNYTLQEDYVYIPQKVLQLERDFECKEGKILKNGTIIIYKGFTWNGVTGWSEGELDHTLNKPKTYYATCVHDFGYKYIQEKDFPYKKEDIDYFFYVIMLQYKFKYAELYYWAVKVFGKWAIHLGTIILLYKAKKSKHNP